MKNGVPDFNKLRLLEARHARGLTQLALGEIINVKSASISRWESGSHQPESKNVQELARALNVPMSFFSMPVCEHGDAPFFFRSKSAATRSIQDRTKVRLRWAQDISIQLQKWVDLPEVNLPHLQVRSHTEISNEDIEDIALECRKLWGIGLSPISDVLLLMENMGVVVVKEEIGSSLMDGLSHWSVADNRPYIYIAKENVYPRSRLDAAHELGHLVLHRYIDEKTLNSTADFKEIERQAFYFAGAFLMPAETFGAEIWTPSLDAFVALKERWRVSIAAMIMRCISLGIISEEYKGQLFKYLSARGWRKSEPLDDMYQAEHPRLLARSIRLLVDNNHLCREQLLADLRFHNRDIESLTSLPSGYLSDDNAEIIPLPQVSLSSENVQGTATVLPFTRKN